MKEKLKNIFKNENLWSCILETICAALIFSIGYFSGFASGLTVDDTIRDELIEKTFDYSKCQKFDIEIDRKEKFDLPYSNFIDFDNQLIHLGSLNSSAESVNVYLDLSFRISYTINNYNSIKLNSFKIYNAEVVSINFSTVEIPTLDEISILGTYDDDISLLPIDNEFFSFSCFDDISFSLPYVNLSLESDLSFLSYNCFYVNDDILTFSYSSNDFLSFFEFIDTSSSGMLGASLFTTELFIDKSIYHINSINVNNSFNEVLSNIYGNIRYEHGLENGGFSGEDLQNAYDSGFQDGKSEGYQEGYQDRKDSVEDTENRINSIWTILEKAITSVLNVLSMEILPGIPLFICIVVPVLLGVILWVIKMGGS